MSTPEVVAAPLQDEPPRRRLEGRVVLVAGASRGLGAAVARAAAAEGAHLVLVARTRGALEEVDDRIRADRGTAAEETAATLVTLDLTDGAMLDRLGAALRERFGRLDGLVSCAADLGPLTPVAHLEPAALERLFAINLFAQHRLIRSLDPLLRAAPAGRAVFVTCEQSQALPPYWGAYAASKAALEALVRTYAAEQRLASLRVNLVDPGPMETGLRARAFPGEPAGRQPAPETLAGGIVDLLTPDCQLSGEIVRL